MTSDGASYVNIIPYVAADANTRTNLGLNNFSQDSLTQGTDPQHECDDRTIRPSG